MGQASKDQAAAPKEATITMTISQMEEMISRHRNKRAKVRPACKEEAAAPQMIDRRLHRVVSVLQTSGSQAQAQ